MYTLPHIIDIMADNEGLIQIKATLIKWIVVLR
jgi:hypothetical protein